MHIVVSVVALVASACGTAAPGAEGTPAPTLSAHPPAQPAPSISRDRVEAAVAELDGLVRETMARTGVPGMAVAVVHGDRTPYLKGFGVRRAGSRAQVGPDTVFQLASLSKPLASTVVAAAVGRGIVQWDDPVAEHDPGFRLKDEWVSRHVTVADLFAHRSGLPDHAGDLLEDLGFGRRYILSHLREEPLTPFRASYAYTNFGFTAAALAVARAAGTTWAELSSDLLYEPLGMRATSSRFTDYEKAADRAVGHQKVNGRWEARQTRDPRAQAPAGGASSTVRDLVAWMRVQLGRRSLGGPRADEALARTWIPHIVNDPPAAPYGTPGFYGLGWNVGYDAAGRLRLNHSGAFSLGAATTVTLLPTEGLGIVVLTNASPVGAAEAVAAGLFDIAEHGRQTVDWLKLYGEAITRSEESTKPRTDYAKPPADAAPARDLAAYAGTYTSPYYGPLVVTVEDGGLVMRLGPDRMRFPLRHYAGDVFSYETPGENAVGLAGVRFAASGGGIGSVTLENLDRTGLGTFTRGGPGG